MSYGAILVFYACIIRLCHDFIKSKLKRVIAYFIVSVISLFLIGATYNSKQINLSEKLIKDFSLTDDSILKTENQISKVLIPSDKHRLNKKLDNKIYNFLDSEIEKGIKSHNVKSIDSVVGELKYEKNDNQREKLKEKAENGKNKIQYYNLNERISAAENTKNESSLNDLLSSVESMNSSEEKSKLLNKINTIKDDIAKDKAENEKKVEEEKKAKEKESKNFSNYFNSVENFISDINQAVGSSVIDSVSSRDVKPGIDVHLNSSIMAYNNYKEIVSLINVKLVENANNNSVAPLFHYYVDGLEIGVNRYILDPNKVKFTIR